jgi:hypothetical protein
MAIELTDDELEFEGGLSDATLKKSLKVDLATQEPKVQEFAAGRLAKAVERTRRPRRLPDRRGGREGRGPEAVWPDLPRNQTGTGPEAKATDR